MAAEPANHRRDEPDESHLARGAALRFALLIVLVDLVVFALIAILLHDTSVFGIDVSLALAVLLLSAMWLSNRLTEMFHQRLGTTPANARSKDTGDKPRIRDVIDAHAFRLLTHVLIAYTIYLGAVFFARSSFNADFWLPRSPVALILLLATPLIFVRDLAFLWYAQRPLVVRKD